jgi:DNA-binding transcriptional ArsR family regulator
MAGKDKPDLQALLTSLAHELRRRILRAMQNGERLSPCELAELLEEGLSGVSYHVLVLVENGVLRPAGEKQVNGATQHFYRSALEAGWAKQVLAEPEEAPPEDKS